MSLYTTGEIARLCGVSVRTVQFYDGKNLLKPSDLSEGGRRLYTENDCARLRLIVLLKSIGLTLDSIKGILASEHPEAVLRLLLNEQEALLNREIRALEGRKQTIADMRGTLKTGLAPSLESIADMDAIMEESKKLNGLHGAMLAIGMLMSGLQWFGIIYWIVTGVWWPFVACLPAVAVMGVLVTRMYHRNTLYLCPACGARFRPSMREMLWARHTPKTRKLTCTHCGVNGWCVETFGRETEKNEGGK